MMHATRRLQKSFLATRHVHVRFSSADSFLPDSLLSNILIHRRFAQYTNSNPLKYSLLFIYLLKTLHFIELCFQKKIENNFFISLDIDPHFLCWFFVGFVCVFSSPFSFLYVQKRTTAC